MHIVSPKFVGVCLGLSTSAITRGEFASARTHGRIAVCMSITGMIVTYLIVTGLTAWYLFETYSCPVLCGEYYDYFCCHSDAYCYRNSTYDYYYCLS